MLTLICPVGGAWLQSSHIAVCGLAASDVFVWLARAGGSWKRTLDYQLPTFHVFFFQSELHKNNFVREIALCTKRG
jgi:hypothetical protein